MTENVEQIVGSVQIRDRAICLFTYLKELCALRTTQVRTVASYDQVFWFSDLPRDKLCQCIAWSINDVQQISRDQISDVWIEVHKPKLKSPPELPDDVEPWISEEQLHDSSVPEPLIFDQIPLTVFRGDAQDADSTAPASLNDHPEIFEAWIKYLETQWKPWAEEDRKLQKVQKVYNHLFNIYQRQERLGEQYEVVLGIGLLAWQSPHSGEIKRHIVTVQSRIEFDRVRGIITVGPAPTLDGQQRTSLEHEMLIDTSDKPNATMLNAINNDVKALDEDPWKLSDLEKVLRGFVHALPNPGDFDPTLDHNVPCSSRPVINLAPALILRKRSGQNFTSFYQKMIEQMAGGEKVPENIHRIVDVLEDLDVPTESHNNLDPDPINRVAADPELYFPLPANDEQKKIVKFVERRQGVLVQGPPGTGKSHTIVNLIAHFLAKGKRVLVTSETPRALNVLRDKLPSEIEELCVVWLGSDKKSRDALEKSVRGITHRKESWDANSATAEITRLTKALDGERREQQKLYRERQTCREADVDSSHSGVFGRYSGTLQKIAMQVNTERPRFDWFIDRPSDAAKPGVTPPDLLQMLRIHRQLTAQLVADLKLRLFPLNELPPPDEFCRLVADEKCAMGAHVEAQGKREYPGYAKLSGLPRETRQTVIQVTEGILAAHDHLSKHYQNWVARAALEISGDQDRAWRHVLSSTKDHLVQIERIFSERGEIGVFGMEGKNLHVVTEDATILKSHLESGKYLGFWMFRSRVVKRCLYLIRDIQVDDKLCNNVENLQRLLAWLEISTRLQTLSDLWKDIATPPEGSAAIQCSTYRDFCEPIADALTMHDQIQQVKVMCRDCVGIRFPAWHSPEEVSAFLQALAAVTVDEDLQIARHVFQPLTVALTEHLNHGGAHPTTNDLHKAVSQRNCDAYRSAYEAISNLHTWAESYRVLCATYDSFRKCAPRTCKTYAESYNDFSWDDRLRNFDDAWSWATTDRWLDEACDREKPKRIMRALGVSVARERDLLKQLAAIKAWQHCMASLDESKRQNLEAWAQAVGRRGFQHGRDAETLREEARKKLEKCREAIPAWVMPLYQVVQTIRPQAGIFDLVIIDEASQSGPEALLLNYIAEKIVVVGDDKQITPLYVGIPLDQVKFLRQMHLRDIPHADLLGLDSSLYAQAALRFPARVRLREHFRCMPEIIQFSNNLSYATEPLIPLRQYGVERLEPVKTVYVEGGYRRGSDENLENPPEAEAIVAQIAQCCEDPAYQAKTFGVICLLGSHQAELIGNLLVQEIGAAEVERRRITCGRPYDFQGDERDVIFLSMVDAPVEGKTCRMIRDPDTQRRFNVAASRARDQLWLFHSATLNDLRPDCLRYRLLEYCLKPTVQQPEEVGDTTITDLRRMALDRTTREGNPPPPFDSWFEVDVFLRIVDKGYRVLPQFEVNGRYIDLVVEGLRNRLAVECDGDSWHGPEQFMADSIRRRDLERCGWTFWTIRGSDFYRDPDTALTPLWETLERLSIVPKHLWETQRKRQETETPSAPEAATIDDDTEISTALEDEDETAETDHKSSDRMISAETPEGRLDRALAYDRLRRRRLEDLPPCDIQKAIVAVLQGCPNRSCTIKSIASRVLKELDIITRGNPRLEFEKRVMRNIGTLKRKGLLDEYKAKNRRLRLRNGGDQQFLL